MCIRDRLPDIPPESDYLKVLLPYQTPKSTRDTIPSDLSSDTFYHVFGGNSNIFESFVIQNKIMGPCWLNIKGADFNSIRNASHCAIEAVSYTHLDVYKRQISYISVPLNIYLASSPVV